MDSIYNYSKNSSKSLPSSNNINGENSFSVCLDALKNWFKSFDVNFGALFEILKVPHILFLIVILTLATVGTLVYICGGKHYFKNLSGKGEPVLVCKIDGKTCSLDGTVGPWNGTETYVFHPSGEDAVNYAPARLFDQSNPISNTYSYWIRISSQDWGNPRYFNNWKHIMHRGTYTTDAPNIRQGPGFWLWPKENNLWCIVNTANGPKDGEGILLENLKFDRWINVTLVLDNQAMDLYIDGKLEKTVILRGTPVHTGKDNLYIGTNGGFPGDLAFIQFYSRALTPAQVNNIYEYYNKYISEQIDREREENANDAYKKNMSQFSCGKQCKENYPSYATSISGKIKDFEISEKDF